MIPFDVDPMGYYLSALLCICIVALVLLYIFDRPQMRPLCLIFMIAFSILLLISFVLLVVDGSAYTDTITICAHTEGNYMKVVDTNQNLYYVSDDLTRMKVKDNATVKVKIKESHGTKYIYSIDAPITCGNQTCGVVPI